jgi:hypothetical protein
MPIRSRKSVVAVVLFGSGLALAACGGSAAHVVGSGATRPTPVTASTTTTVPATPATSAPASVPGATTTTVAPVGTAALNQLNTDLGSVDDSLGQANNDLNNAKGDQ